MLHSETRLYVRSLTSNKCMSLNEVTLHFSQFLSGSKEKELRDFKMFPQIQFQTSKTFYEESAFERSLKCVKRIYTLLLE